MKTPAERLRQQFRCLIASLQSATSDEPVLETILISDGMYFGRKFHLDGFSLTFFSQEERVKISDPTLQIIYSESLERFLAESWNNNYLDKQAA